MSYQKIFVDNTTCMRRFHITFDDEQKPKEHVVVKCLHCGVEVFSKTNHPPVKLARDENLIQTNQMSSVRMKTCDFKDRFSPPSQPK